jgi:dienelactone hydrolase
MEKSHIRGVGLARKGNSMRRLSLLLCLPVLVSAAQPPRRAQAVVREMSLTSADGFALKGTLTVPPMAGPRPVVILAHQFRTDRSGWQPLASQLNAKGIATLALDLRGHGESTWRAGQRLQVTDDFLASAQAVGFDRIPADLAQAAAWVRRQPRIDPRRLGLAGASVGAYSVLLAAPEVHPVAVLALSPGGKAAFGDGDNQRLGRAVQQARAAVMVFAAQDDGEVPATAESMKPLAGVWVRSTPGNAHGFAFLPEDAGFMAGWLGEYLVRHAPARKPQPAAPITLPPADSTQPQA